MTRGLIPGMLLRNFSEPDSRDITGNHFFLVLLIREHLSSICLNRSSRIKAVVGAGSVIKYWNNLTCEINLKWFQQSH